MVRKVLRFAIMMVYIKQANLHTLLAGTSLSFGSIKDLMSKELNGLAATIRRTMYISRWRKPSS